MSESESPGAGAAGEPRSFRTIEMIRSGRVCTIALAIPERKNPIGPAMVNELLYALDDAAAHPQVRVIVLTGRGGAFSAGGDLKQMAEGGDAGPALPPKGDFADLLLRFQTLGKPTIAAVPGVAVGGGLGLVASCDFAIAAESAVLGTPEIRRGLFPSMIMAVLSRVVPRRKLLSMMLLGQKLSAHEAEAIGLLSQVVPDDALEATVNGLAEKLAAQSPSAMRMALTTFHQMADMSYEAALPYLKGQFAKVLGTDDAREGLMAYLEKRPPVWQDPK